MVSDTQVNPRLMPHARVRCLLLVGLASLLLVTAQDDAPVRAPSVFSRNQHHRRSLHHARGFGGGFDGFPGAGGAGAGGGAGYGGWGGPGGGGWTGFGGGGSTPTTSPPAQQPTTSDPTTTHTTAAQTSSPSSPSQPPLPTSSAATAENNSGGTSSPPADTSAPSQNASSPPPSSGTNTDAGTGSSPVTKESSSSTGTTLTLASSSTPPNPSPTSTSSNSTVTGAAIGSPDNSAIVTTHHLSPGAIAGIAITVTLLALALLGYLFRRCRHGGTRRYRMYSGNDVVPFVTGRSETPATPASEYSPNRFMQEKFVVVRPRGGSTSGAGPSPGTAGISSARMLWRQERAALVQRLADRIRERDKLQLQRVASRGVSGAPPSAVIDITSAASEEVHHSHGPPSIASLLPGASASSPAPKSEKEAMALGLGEEHGWRTAVDELLSPDGEGQRAGMGTDSDWRDAHIERQDFAINQLSLEVAQLQAVLARYENEPSDVHDEVLPEYASESGTGHQVVHR